MYTYNKELNTYFTAEGKEVLFVSFSGGRTSAYMTQMLLEFYSDKYEFIVVYANTGREHLKTLEFIRNCDVNLGFNTVWVEASVNPLKGKGTTHTIVDFNTADRYGVVFESVISKYGIPNVSYPHCTRELKLQPMHSYMKSIGLKPNKVKTAIGIRADETRRVRDTKDLNLLYPLVTMFPTTKEEVNDYWRLDSSFDLGLEEFEGNCTTCFKKSDKKLIQLFNKYPEEYAWNLAMEQKYSYIGCPVEGTTRRFFRKNRSTEDIISLANEIGNVELPTDYNLNSGCTESCELYTTE